MNETITGLLIEQSWKLFHVCNCGGSRREHYSNTTFPGYEIRIRPTRSTFTILKNNMLLAGPKYLYDLEKTLKEKEIYKL